MVRRLSFLFCILLFPVFAWPQTRQAQIEIEIKTDGDKKENRRERREDREDEKKSEDRWIPPGHRYQKQDDSRKRRRGSNERNVRHNKGEVRDYFIAVVANYFSGNCDEFVQMHHDPVYFLDEDKFIARDEIEQLCTYNIRRFQGAVYGRTSLREYLDNHIIEVYTREEMRNYHPKVIRKLAAAESYRPGENDYIVSGFALKENGRAVARYPEFFVFIIRKTECGYKIFGYLY